MKKLLASAVLAVMTTAGFGVATAAADVSASVCYSASVTVNGDNVLNEAACNTAP